MGARQVGLSAATAGRLFQAAGLEMSDGWAAGPVAFLSDWAFLQLFPTAKRNDSGLWRLGNGQTLQVVSAGWAESLPAFAALWDFEADYALWSWVMGGRTPDAIVLQGFISRRKWAAVSSLAVLGEETPVPAVRVEQLASIQTLMELHQCKIDANGQTTCKHEYPGGTFANDGKGNISCIVCGKYYGRDVYHGTYDPRTGAGAVQGKGKGAKSAGASPAQDEYGGKRLFPDS